MFQVHLAKQGEVVGATLQPYMLEAKSVHHDEEVLPMDTCRTSARPPVSLVIYRRESAREGLICLAKFAWDFWDTFSRVL